MQLSIAVNQIATVHGPGTGSFFPAVNGRYSHARRLSPTGSPGKMCLSPWHCRRTRIPGRERLHQIKVPDTFSCPAEINLERGVARESPRPVVNMDLSP